MFKRALVDSLFVWLPIYLAGYLALPYAVLAIETISVLSGILAFLVLVTLRKQIENLEKTTPLLSGRIQTYIVVSTVAELYLMIQFQWWGLASLWAILLFAFIHSVPVKTTSGG